MDTGPNSGTGGETPAAGAVIDCRVVRAIIDAGLHRLTDEALQELSNHLDACSDCFKAFDRFYPVALVGDSSGADSMRCSLNTSVNTSLSR
jgi:hypothetical protein